MEYAVTFKFYDKKGRRLSAFARYISPVDYELFILTCSLKDRFVKKYAHNIYKQYIACDSIEGLNINPLILNIFLKPEERMSKSLIDVMTRLSYTKQNHANK